MFRRPSALFIYAIAFMIFLYGPVMLMPVFSFNDSTFATFPLKGFTTRHYASMLANTSMILSLKNSLVVGVIVSVTATAIGLPAAIALTRYRLPGGGPVLERHDAAAGHSFDRHSRGAAGHHPALPAPRSVPVDGWRRPHSALHPVSR